MIGPFPRRLDAGAAHFASNRVAVSQVVAITVLAATMLLGIGDAGAAVVADSVNVRFTHFSPNADGIQDTTAVWFYPQTDSTTITVEVRVVRVREGLPDSLVATPRAATPGPSGELMEVGWSPAPASVADGNYRFDILLDDGVDSDSTGANIVVDTVAPTVELGYAGHPVAPSIFDPAATAPNHELVVPVRVTGDSTTAATVQVWDGDDHIRDLGPPIGPIDSTFTWDGTAADDSTELPSGPYEVLVVAQDLAGNLDVQSVGRRIDRAGPTWVFDSPDTTMTATFPIELSGTTFDDHEVVAVAYQIDAETTWTEIALPGGAAASVPWVVPVDTPDSSRGVFQVRLKGTDRFGHATLEQLWVAHDVAFPQVFSTSPVDSAGVAISGAVYRDGDEVRLLTTWSSSDLDLRADFTNLDSAYFFGQETVSVLGAGAYLIVYRVAPTNSHPSGPKTVTLQASTGILATEAFISLQLEDGHGDDLVAIDRNRFDPETGDVVTIASESPSAILEIEIFDLGGHRVRELEGAGSVIWNGLDSQGRSVASGVYFLRILVDDVEEMRKVAVMRGR